MSSIRKAVSGGEKAAELQLTDELKHISPETRLSILQQPGIKPCIPEGEGMAMKAELSLPWYRLRQLKSSGIAALQITTPVVTRPICRWLAHWGVKMKPEGKQREGPGFLPH